MLVSPRFAGSGVSTDDFVIFESATGRSYHWLAISLGFLWPTTVTTGQPAPLIADSNSSNQRHATAIGGSAAHLHDPPQLAKCPA